MTTKEANELLADIINPDWRMKAQVGDYIRKDGSLVQVMALDGDSGYLTSDGGVISDSELALDDVLLESEALA